MANYCQCVNVCNQLLLMKEMKRKASPSSLAAKHAMQSASARPSVAV